MRVSLEGKVSSVKEQQLLGRDQLQRCIVRAERRIMEEGAGTWRDRLHQKKRRRGNLKERPNQLEGDIDSGRVWLCLGSRKLWRKQHH